MRSSGTQKPSSAKSAALRVGKSEVSSGAVRPLRFVIAVGVVAILAAGWWSYTQRRLTPNELRQMPLGELERRAQRGPGAYEALCVLGERQTVAGTPELAAETFRRARELEPATPAAIAGYILVTAGRRAPGWAEAGLLQLAQADSAGPAVALALGELYQLQGDYDSAGEHFRRAVNLDPKDSEAHFQLGEWTGEIGATGKALESMQRATQLAPKVGRYYVGMADLEMHLGRYAEARKHLEQAKALDGPTLLSNFHSARLLALDKPTKESRTEAVRLLRLCLAEAPDWERPRLALGRALIALGETQEGISYLQSSVRGEHADPQVLAALSRAYYKVNQPAQGDAYQKRYEKELARQRQEEVVKNRLRSEPKEIPLRLKRARELLAIGAVLPALRLYREILAIDPKQPEALKMATALVRLPR